MQRQRQRQTVEQYYSPLDDLLGQPLKVAELKEVKVEQEQKQEQPAPIPACPICGGHHYPFNEYGTEAERNSYGT